ncbi:MAG: GTP cyclohydrolase II, partial [Aestuariibacter sp.]|nr:GTP cyclohydrolase II [Aestuariibacter sp.]
MFTYLNPDVRQRLTEAGKLIRIGSDGSVIDEATSAADSKPIINILGPIPLPLKIGGLSYKVDWYAAVRSTELEKVESLASTLRDGGGQNLFSTLATSMAVNSVLLIGDPLSAENPLVRVHSNCLTGDVFGSQRCECGPQLESAVQRISQDPSGGLIVYMSGHEGRGIGLWAKAATYLL